MAHVQLAAGIGQHGTGIELLFARVFADPVCVTLGPVGLCDALDIEMVIFVLHVKKDQSGQRGATRTILGGSAPPSVLGGESHPLDAGLLGCIQHGDHLAIGHSGIRP